MVNLKRTQYTMILIIAVLFVWSVALTVLAGIGIQKALIDATLDSLQVNYNVIQFANASNPLILVAKLLDAIIFPIFTVLLAAWFFDLINRVNLREIFELNKIKKLEDHVIVVPYNNFGKALLNELRKAGVKAVTIVENRKELAQLYKDGELAIHGDVRSVETFEIVKVGKAKGVIACSKDDVQNALITITAKTANPHIKIIARASKDDDVKGLMSAGAFKTLIPERTAGEDIGKEISSRVLAKRSVKA